MPAPDVYAVTILTSIGPSRSGRAGPGRRARRERDSACRAGARRTLRRRRVQRARGRRPQSVLRHDVRDVLSRHPPERNRARRSEARSDAARSARGRRGLRRRRAARSSKMPIRSAPRARSSRSCKGERRARRPICCASSRRAARSCRDISGSRPGGTRTSSCRSSASSKIRCSSSASRARWRMRRAPLAPTVVVSAAVGGIVLGYETARQLGTLGIFVEKENGKAALRRGFALGPGDRAFVVEDVVTTGGSVREVLDVIRAHGATVAGGGRHRAPRAGRLRRPHHRAARSPDRVARSRRVPAVPRRRAAHRTGFAVLGAMTVTDRAQSNRDGRMMLLRGRR